MTDKRYDKGWHDFYGDRTKASARKLLPYIFQIFEPKSVLEVGCGHGHWISTVAELGVKDVLGVDGEWTDRSKLLIGADRFLAQDLGADLDLGRRFDIVICLEVAEHLEKKNAIAFIDNICRHSDVVLFGAAIPYQGGLNHVNEQWQSYWIDLFGKRRFKCFDLLRPVFWNDQDILYYYRQNSLIYVNAVDTKLTNKCEILRDNIARTYPPMSMAHPEKFETVASYEQVVLKRMLPRLPQAIGEVLRRRIFGVG